MSLKQEIPLPEPLRAEEEPSFTHYSVAVRLPNIARRALEENEFPPETVERIQKLINEIPQGTIRPLEIEPHTGRWEAYVRPYLGQNWLQVPWFFAEEYFYARILEATGYFQAGEWYRRDPYKHQKRMGLESSRPAIRSLAGQVKAALYGPGISRRDALERMVLANLWGNQNDLSMWPVSKDASNGKMAGGSAAQRDSGSQNGSGNELAEARKHLLADDTPALLDYFSGLDPAQTRVDIILDNAGYELVTDLALADFLLSSGLAAQVTLHAKSYPVFVSDALDRDIFDTLEFMLFDNDALTKALAVTLRGYLVEERLRLRHHPFWTSPLPAWDMPADLLEELEGSSLLISKGDANYRRLLGDRHWPVSTPFGEVVNYFPSAVLSLRTLKSEIAVGVDPDRIPQDDPEWMINGRWGLIQFAQ